MTPRYTLAGGYKAEPDPDGEWVLFRDVRLLVARCGEIAAQRDQFELALRRIARAPINLPSSAAGVSEARRVLSAEGDHANR